MSNYIMIGAGGTGTHLLHPLHAYLAAHHKDGDWMLFILDGDIVEQKNLERQLFVPGAVTMNKAEAAARSVSSTAHVVARPEYLSEENINRFIQEGDIVLICADNMVVRKRIEDHARTLDNVIVINGGNEKHTGSIQLWVRRDGEDITPRIGYLHPEVTAEGPDRAEMTCAQAAALPGGEQTVIANMQAATWMLTALWRYHNDLYELAEGQEPTETTWTELQFDAWNGEVDHIDWRTSSHWRNT